jgi:mevalonate kinase
MSIDISTTAPGKTIVLGDHVVVNGYPGLVVPIKQTASSRIFSAQNKQLTVKLVNFNSEYQVSAVDLASSRWLSQMRAKKQKALSGGKIGSYLADFRSSPFNLVRSAIETAFEFAKRSGNADMTRLSDDLELVIDSEIPQGGFGSSTAVTVATMKAVLQLLGRKYSLEELAKLTISAEALFYASEPSGLDQFCISYNSAIIYQRDNHSSKITRINTENNSIPDFEVIDTLTPKFATGEVVAYLQAEIVSNPEKKRLFAELGELTTSLIDQIKTKGIESITKDQWISSFRRISTIHLKLGLVTEYTAKVIEKYEKSGGGAKFSGAGTIAHLEQNAGSGKIIGIR